VVEPTRSIEPTALLPADESVQETDSVGVVARLVKARAHAPRFSAGSGAHRITREDNPGGHESPPASDSISLGPDLSASHANVGQEAKEPVVESIGPPTPSPWRKLAVAGTLVVGLLLGGALLWPSGKRPNPRPAAAPVAPQPDPVRNSPTFGDEASPEVRAISPTPVSEPPKPPPTAQPAVSAARELNPPPPQRSAGKNVRAGALPEPPPSAKPAAPTAEESNPPPPRKTPGKKKLKIRNKEL
jgi:hypothetical protein